MEPNQNNIDFKTNRGLSKITISCFIYNKTNKTSKIINRKNKQQWQHIVGEGSVMLRLCFAAAGLRQPTISDRTMNNSDHPEVAGKWSEAYLVHFWTAKEKQYPGGLVNFLT